MSYLPILSLCVGGWMVLNGLLHDLVILNSERGKTYDRELLRLLMDGHILITCGLLQIIAFFGLRHGEYWAYWVGALACVSLLVYGGMIFPFLKSFGMLTLNGVLLVLLLWQYFTIH